MKVGILHRGDKVLSVTERYIAVQRSNGEVELIPLVMDETRTSY